MRAIGKIIDINLKQWSEVHFGQRGNTWWHVVHTKFDENPTTGSEIMGGNSDIIIPTVCLSL